MPATDSTASSTIENDTLPITRTVPGTGDEFYDANRLYGQVLYVDGLETDQPLAITRNHYADASSTKGSETYAVYAPYSVIPLWNSQGRADRSVVGGTAAPGQDGVCVDGGVTRCASVYLDLGVFPYARTGASLGSWNGTLLIDKADATGTYYRRNRSYDPATARFTQEDPIGLAGGLNAYGFASGDPANYGDPFGLWPWPDETTIQAAIFAAQLAITHPAMMRAIDHLDNIPQQYERVVDVVKDLAEGDEGEGHSSKEVVKEMESQIARTGSKTVVQESGEGAAELVAKEGGKLFGGPMTVAIEVVDFLYGKPLNATGAEPRETKKPVPIR